MDNSLTKNDIKTVHEILAELNRLLPTEFNEEELTNLKKAEAQRWRDHIELQADYQDDADELMLVTIASWTKWELLRDIPNDVWNHFCLSWQASDRFLRTLRLAVLREFEDFHQDAI